MTNFGHLKKLDPTSRKEWYEFPTDPPLGRLHVCHAGRTNKPYTKALMARNAKTGLNRRLARGKIDATVLDENEAADRELFPKFIITGWEGVKDQDGNEVPYSHENCREFIAQLPAWLMQDLSNFCGTASNFIDDDQPDELETSEAAGN